MTLLDILYSRGAEFVTVSVPFFAITVRSVKRTEPSILTVRLLVFGRKSNHPKMEKRYPFIIEDRELYRTKNWLCTVRSQILKNWTVTIEGSVRFTLLTVILKKRYGKKRKTVRWQIRTHYCTTITLKYFATKSTVNLSILTRYRSRPVLLPLPFF